MAFDCALQEAGCLRSLGKAAAQGEPADHTAEQREAHNPHEGARARTMAQWRAPPSADHGPRVIMWSRPPTLRPDAHPSSGSLAGRAPAPPSAARPCPTGGIHRRLDPCLTQGHLDAKVNGFNPLWEENKKLQTFSLQGLLCVLGSTLKHWFSSKINMNLFIEQNDQSLRQGAIYMHSIHCLHAQSCEFGQTPPAGRPAPRRGAAPTTPLCSQPHSLSSSLWCLPMYVLSQ